MEALTFGEQVKIILSRKGMTIKELAEIIEDRTGKKMSRQNLTQRLGRDNFQEQDMRLIADVLSCPFRLSLFTEEFAVEQNREEPLCEDKETEQVEGDNADERDMTIGELYEIHEELKELEADAQKDPTSMEAVEEKEYNNLHEVIEKPSGGEVFLRKKGGVTQEQGLEREKTELVHESQFRTDKFEPVIKLDDVEENRDLGDMNPYTGREFLSNSVRMHPGRIGYVQVYDRSTHKWTDMTEWAFLGYQERKKALLGKDYEPPIYLD